MCCGQKREAAKQQPARQVIQSNIKHVAGPPQAPPSVRQQQANTHHVPSGLSMQRLRYLQRSPIRVRGTVTGKNYEFSAVDAVRLVDARDVEPLLQTRFFVRADAL